MPVTDAITYLHGTPTTPVAAFTSTAATGDESANVLDFGAPLSGAAYPYLPEFPSIAEKGYTFPPEVVGDGGVELGVHLVISTAIGTGAGMTLGTVIVSTGAADTVGTTVASRVFTLAQLAIAGAHYFIPVNFASVLRYLACYFQATTGVANSGTVVAWFGPKTGGEQ
jgi:hypothetical protein